MSKCVGCGAILQCDDEKLDGYVEDITHKICNRCFKIKNYGENRNITRTNLDYMNILNRISDNDLVVYVSSLLTLNLEYVKKFKNVILVLTKRDVLPKSVKNVKIVNYVKNRYDNLIDVLIVSAYKKINLDLLYDKINKYGWGRNIYFVGITNSGKSTLINEMIKSYTGEVGKITMSNYPSTTLDVIDVKIGNLTVKDTPGIVIDNSIINYLSDKEIKKINSKKEIKPITIQIKGNGAILIDEIIRLEYETEESSVTFYISNNLSVKNISLNNPRLIDDKERCFNLTGNQDVVIEDIGFIKFTKMTKIKIKCSNEIFMYVRDKLI